MELIIIAAVANNNIIGNKGSIPWHSKEDFKHFKETTFGYPILMGRKTFESIGKPLKGRLNIIITRNKNFVFEHDDVIIFNGLKSAVDYCENNNFKKAFIIGGSEIYNQSLSFSDKLLISRMKVNVEGDTFFPNIEKDWKVIKSDDFNDFVLKEYVKK